MVRILLASLFIIPLLSTAQGQSCGLRDTVLIVPLTTSTFTLAIEDYVNDDLSDPDQGLCGVEVRFVHQYIDQFSMHLTAPAGQTVDLIGPPTDEQGAFTFFAQWAINFVPCAEPALPDMGYTAVFDNEQPNNFVSGGLYTGSYYPYQGCLEDFDTGPVNGTWTLTLDNTASSFYSGAVVYVRLTFCDARGVDCCLAQAGTLGADDLLVCEGDTSLDLSYDPSFVLDAPDATDFGYTYVLAQDSVFLGLDSLPDLTAFPAGNYQVCGLSYRRSEIDTFWMANGSVTLDTIFDDLGSFFPRLCAEITPDCQTITIVAPPPPTLLDTIVCMGEPVQVGDTLFSTTGLHEVTLSAFAGCDSLVRLDLTVIPPDTTFLTQTICEGDTVFIGSSVYTTTGNYADPLQTVGLGCDSLVLLDLSVLAPIITPVAAAICAGETYAVGNSLFSTSGDYTIELLSAANCDSIVELSLTVLNPIANVVPPDTITCALEAVVLDAGPSLPTGQLTFQWYDPTGGALGVGPTQAVTAAGDYILAVSQVEFGTICLDSTTVNVYDNRIFPIADAGLPDTLTCADDSLLLGGSATSLGPNFTYSWQAVGSGDPMPTDAPQTTVTIPDTYSLIVTDTENACRDTATVTVAIDTLAPVFAVDGNEILSCTQTLDTLQVTNLPTGNYAFDWSGPCIESTSVETAIVSCAGDYMVQVTNLANGCSQSQVVTVTENLELIDVNIAPVDTLTCTQTSVMLDASASQPMGQLAFAWTGPGIGAALTTSGISTSIPGAYQLVLTRLDNGCVATLAIEVYQDTLVPVADAGPPQMLNCLQPSTSIGGPNTTPGAPVVYQWYDSDGLIPAATNVTFLVTEADLYTLIVENTDNGCQDTSSVVVGSDFATPLVETVSSVPFSCGADTVTLDGTNTNIDYPALIEWSGPCLVGPTDQLSAQAACPGNYWLHITHLASGCQDSAQVEVVLQPNAAIATLPDSVLQDCVTGEATLLTAGTSPGIYTWFRDGVSVQLPFPDPVVDQPGLYTLVVSNVSGNCQDTATVIVYSDCTPTSVVSVSDTLDCVTPFVTISGQGSSFGAAIEYEWLADDPACVVTTDVTTPELEVQCPGTYGLITRNTTVNAADTTYVEVYSNTTTPIALAGPNDTLTCTNSSVMLTGMVDNDDGSNYAFFWTEDVTGDTLSTTGNLLATEVGNYLFTVYNIENGCSDIDQTQVLGNSQLPDISFGATVIPCMADTFRLMAFVTPLSTYDYTWTGPGIVADADQAGVLIGVEGNYTLTVFDPVSGCSATESIVVAQQPCAPCPELVAVDTLTCMLDTATIEIALCQPCFDCDLVWSDANGPLPGATGLLLEVTATGSYTLVVTDTSGFTGTLTVEVVEDREAPMIDLPATAVLNCYNPTLTLGDSSLLDPTLYSSTWIEMTAPDNILATTAFFMVTEPGNYQYAVMDLVTGCTNSAIVVVSLDNIPPTAMAGDQQTLTCEQSVVTLNGTGSSTGNDFTYLWTGPMPGCITGATTLSPIVSCPGEYTLLVTDVSNGCTTTATVFVGIQESLPQVIPYPDTVLNCYAPALFLQGNLPTTGNFEPLWCEINDNDETLPTTCVFDTEKYVDQPGRYRYTLTDLETGCSNSFIVVVGEDFAPPVVDAGTDVTLPCTLNSLSLTGMAGPNTTVVWTQSDGLPIDDSLSLTPTIYQPGWYSLEATNIGNGCTAIDSVEVFQDENAPTADAGMDDVFDCETTTLTLLGSGSTNSGQLSYAWSGATGEPISGASTPTPTITVPGIYTLSVTDPVNGCVTESAVTIGYDTLAPQAQIVDIEQLQLDCRVDTLVIDGSTSSTETGNALLFDWRVRTVGQLVGATDLPQVLSDAPGAYVLEVTDAGNLCTDTLHFTILPDFTPPDLSVDAPLPITCAQDSSILSASSSEAGEFSWAAADGTLIGTSAMVMVTEPGGYTVTFTAEDNGCTQTQTVDIEDARVLPTVVATANGILDCGTPTVTLDGTGSSLGTGISYAWRGPSPDAILTDSTALQAEAAQPGTYWLLVTNELTGCQDSTSVAVSSNGIPIAGVALAVQGPRCPEDVFGNVTVLSVDGGTPPYRYALGEGPFTDVSSFFDLPTGSYTLEVQDALGCTWTETINIEPAQPISLELIAQPDVELGDTVRIQASIIPDTYDTIVWQPSGLFPGNNEAVQYIALLEERFIIATVTDERGCQASDTIQILVNVSEDVFIPTGFSPNNDGSNDRYTVFAGPSVARVHALRIFDRWGNLVFTGENLPPNAPGAGWDGTFHERPANTGVYVYMLDLEYIDGRRTVLTGDLTLVR